MDLLIKNGTLVDSYGMYPANLGIEDGKISVIFQGDKGIVADQEIDATNKLIFPGDGKNVLGSSALMRHSIE